MILRKATFPVLLLLLSQAAWADGPLYEQVHIFGFADIFYAAHLDDSAENGFDFGQMEIDLEAPVAEEISFEAAVAFNPASYTFGVGAFFIDFDIFGSSGSHLADQREGLSHTGIVVGQFDVPFGRDWRRYPSPDRMLVSTPLTTDHITEAWNDVGAKIYTDQPRYNLVGFVSNGLGYQRSVIQGNVVDVEQHDMNHAVGGRAAWRPVWQLEIGLSGTAQFDGENRFDLAMVGGDLFAELGSFELSFEAVLRQQGMADELEELHQGFHGQLAYRWERWFALARYGQLSLDDGAFEQRRLATGVGHILVENVQLRTEYQFNEGDETGDKAFLQVVVSF